MSDSSSTLRIWASATASASANATLLCATSWPGPSVRAGSSFPRSRNALLAAAAIPATHLGPQGRVLRVRQGEVVGIIGRNGAGKSTLLKILGRITKPTRTRSESTAVSASLLEVGTGFHPELTGRENIYLNGAILGMTKNGNPTQVRRDCRLRRESKSFIDTPVKHYSSGMYVRLAFAVAAHLETGNPGRR